MKSNAIRALTSFLLLVLIALTPLGVSYWRSNKTEWHCAGQYPTDMEGESVGLRTLSSSLERGATSNTVGVWYLVPVHGPAYSQKPLPNGIPDEMWVYRLEYNRSDHVLIKRYCKDFSDKEPPVRYWIWDNVSEEAIHELAAVMKAMMDSKQATPAKTDSYLPMLDKYGAVPRSK